MATFCPYCDTEIETQIYQAWAYDYPTDFDFECPKCGKEIEIEVAAIPEFHVLKKK